MCGIVGIINKKQKITQNELISFRDSLEHRGPDGSGLFVDSQFGLGHRRLAILDTSERGIQPMASKNKRYHITYNGEIFNFIELRDELITLGHTFETETDTEVVLAAYVEWGKECLHKFNGMWGFAIYDTEKKSVFISRDRFGIKPVYYINTNDMFAFASETLAFDSLSGFEKEIDQKMLRANLKNVFVIEEKGYTIYKDIFSLRPGHYMEVLMDGKVEQKRWYSLPKVEVPDLYEDQVKEFKTLFENACAIRLRSDVQIGTALSGGMDSSSVYAMVNHIMKQSNVERVPENWQQAYSAQFEGSSLNEAEFAKMVSDFFGGTLNDINISSEEILKNIESDTKHFDCIHMSPLNVLSSIYKRMHESGVVVSLDGHGVDEMMFGYPELVSEAYVQAKLRGNNEYAEDVMDIYVHMFDEEHRQTQKSILESQTTKKALLMKRIKSLIPSSVKLLLSKNTWLRSSFVTLPLIGENVEYNRKSPKAILHKNFFETVLPTILRNFDRASMKHSIEIRMPFMDYRIVEFMFSLSMKSLLGDGFTKRILRDAVKDMLPKEIVTRTRKIGINAPLHEWFAHDFKSYLHTSVQSDLFSKYPVWNGTVIQTYVEDRKDLSVWKWNDAITVWPYLNAYMLLKK